MKIPILIPPDAELLIQKGDAVDFGTPFIRKGNVKDVRIPLATPLGFSPDKIFIHLHKFVGDTVTKNDVLAERKAMMSTKQYVSEYDGTVKEINHYDGSVTLTVKTADTIEETCYFKGIVEELEGGILFLKAARGKAYPLAEPAPYFGGRTFYFEGIPPQQITEDEVNDMVVITPKLQSYDHSKIEALGARALVLLQAPDDQSQVPVAILKAKDDYEEIRKHGFSSCNTGPDRTTIYLYD